MRGCSVIACAILILAAAVLALMVYAWLAAWLQKALAWIDNMTEWLTRNASRVEKIRESVEKIREKGITRSCRTARLPSPRAISLCISAAGRQRNTAPPVSRTPTA